jgi:hypothetical protein
LTRDDDEPVESTQYHLLVNKFPLVPIRDDAHLAEALAVIEPLLKGDLVPGGRGVSGGLDRSCRDLSGAHVEGEGWWRKGEGR